MRTTLLFSILASVVACGAWRAHAEAMAAPPATSRFPPVPSPTSPRKIDEYGNLRWSDEKARLDNYLIDLRNDPRARACIICYGGRRARAGEARTRCARVANYLKRVGGIDAARIITLDGGYREELTVELWAPPAGSTLPVAAPTVDPSEVTIIKDSPKRKRPPRGDTH
ncbi:MAG: hypothetical protein ACJ74T_15680 [Pyrinomonadaceae bacterium]